MQWKRIDKEIIQTPLGLKIPYAPPKPDHLPLSEVVLLSYPLSLPINISLFMTVNKRKISKNTWQEFAWYLADDVETWLGNEIGYRFPLNMETNEFTMYTQRKLLCWNYIFERQSSLTNLNDPVLYSLKVEKILLCWHQVSFSAEDRNGTVIRNATNIWLPKKKLSLAIIAHNWDKTDAQDQYILIQDIILN